MTIIWRACLALLLLAGGPAGAALSEIAPSHVLAVHSYSQEYPWTRGQHAGFVAYLNGRPGLPPQISTEYLNTKLRPLDADYARRYAEFIRIKYAPMPPDAIYASDDNALLFALDHLRPLYPKAPVFFSGVNDYAMRARLAGDAVTGVFEQKDVARNLDLLSQLGLDARHILVLGDGSNTFAAIEADIRAVLAGRAGVAVEFVATPDLDAMLAVLARHPESPVLLATLGGMRAADGRVLALEETLTRLRAATGAAILSMEDAYLGRGIQGGYVTSVTRQGETAAALLDAWRGGRPMASLAPVLDSPNEYQLDETALDRIGLAIPPALLAQARVINPLPDFLDRHRSLLLSLLVLLSGVLLFGVLLLMIHTAEKYE